jgi:hypothetical protein
VKKLLFLTLIFVTSLFAQKVLYVSYNTVPTRVVKGEIFTVTLKTLSTLGNKKQINYKFSNHPGLRILNSYPQRAHKGKFFYDSFSMVATRSYAKLPDIKVYINPTSQYDPAYLKGDKLNVITLNPRKDFSNIIANSLALKEYKTTNYDNRHNIIVFVVTAKNADLSAMHFENVFKQGIESNNHSYRNAKATYYVVIEKNIENFTFSYFNLLKNNYEKISIPIVVDDDSVSTQSDLKPTDQSHDAIKMYIAIAIVLIGLIFVVWKRKYIYLIVLLFPLAYIIYLNMPQKEICIKKGANIYILPVTNGTIFETTQQELHLEKEGKVSHFIKIKLQNEKIGWVRDEDTCTH